MAKPAQTYSRIRPLLYPHTKVMLVGEAPGEKESLMGVPFVGASGDLLGDMLKEVGISREDCSITNVFLDRPQGNKIEEFTCPKADLPADYPLTPLAQGKYVKPKYVPELFRLKVEIEHVQPNLVVALGNVALWALTGLNQIGKYRGTTLTSTLVDNQKVLPTYHPASLFRQWNNRVVVASDLQKVAFEKDFPEIRRPIRSVLINPTLDEVFDFFQCRIEPVEGFSFDLETAGGNFISCISFSPSPTESITIPFVRFDAKGMPKGPYWESLDEEMLVWNVIREYLEGSYHWKMAQNGLFDIQILGLVGIAVRNYTYDTMLAQAALMPELQKSLAFLGSVYTNESSWKVLRPKRKMARTDNKKDD